MQKNRIFQHYLYFTICFFMFFFTNILGTNLVCAKPTCDNIVESLAKLSESGKTVPLTTYSLIQKLGPVNPQSIQQKLYVWKNFMVIVRNNQITKVYGNIPPIYQDAITTPTLEEAVLLLGQPKENPQLNLFHYTWICENYGSMINVYSDQKGNVVSYDGLVCKSNIKNCEPFDTIKFSYKNFTAL